MKTALLSIACLALAGAGCRSKSEAPRAEVTPKASASVAPAPSASVAPPNPTEPSALPVERPKQSLPLKLALSEFPPEYPNLYGRGVFDVYAVRGGTLVTLGEQLFLLEDGKLVEIPIDVGEQKLNGMMVPPLYVELGKVSGRHPGELWVEAGGMWVSDGARIHSQWSGLYRQRDGEWLEVASGQPGFAATEVVGWSGGRSVAWSDAGFEILSGPKKQKLPQRTPGKQTAARVAIDAIAALPSGDLYAVGQDGQRPGAFALEHWNDGQEQALGVHELPSWFCTGPGTIPAGKSTAVSLLAASPQRVFAVCRGKLEGGLLLFDGKSVHVLAPPATGKLHGSAVGEDGSLWLVTATSAFALDPRGDWRELAVPSMASLKRTVVDGLIKAEGALHLQLSSVAVSAALTVIAGSLYDTQSNAQRTFLFASDDTTLELPKRGDKAASTAPSAGTVPVSASAEGSALGPDCKTPFVVLYSVSDSAPPDYAYPATRDALASVSPKPDAQFVEFRFKQHRTLGAKVSSAEKAKALVDLITTRVKGSKPTALCLDPTPALIRELKL